MVYRLVYICTFAFLLCEETLHMIDTLAIQKGNQFVSIQYAIVSHPVYYFHFLLLVRHIQWLCLGLSVCVCMSRKMHQRNCFEAKSNLNVTESDKRTIEATNPRLKSDGHF